MGTLKGEAILPFSILPYFQCRVGLGGECATLKGKNLLLYELILSFNSLSVAEK